MAVIGQMTSGRIIGDSVKDKNFTKREIHFLSSSERRVFFDAAPPHEAGERIHHQHPEQLRDEAGDDVVAGNFAHVNADGNIKHRGKRREGERVLERGRQHVQRKHVAAGEIFKREQDEDERRDFQNPERQHRHRIGQEKLQQRRQHE